MMAKKDKIKITLSEISKELPFNVPGGYFDDFSSRLQQQILPGSRPSVLSGTHQSVMPRLIMAASIIAFVAVSYVAYRFLINPAPQELPYGESSLVMNDYLYYIDEDILMSAINEENIYIDWINGYNESDAIIEYLADDDIDLTKLIMDY